MEVGIRLGNVLGAGLLLEYLDRERLQVRHRLIEGTGRDTQRDDGRPAITHRLNLGVGKEGARNTRYQVADGRHGILQVRHHQHERAIPDDLPVARGKFLAHGPLGSRSPRLGRSRELGRGLLHDYFLDRDLDDLLNDHRPLDRHDSLGRDPSTGRSPLAARSRRTGGTRRTARRR